MCSRRAARRSASPARRRTRCRRWPCPRTSTKSTLTRSRATEAVQPVRRARHDDAALVPARRLERRQRGRDLPPARRHPARPGARRGTRHVLSAEEIAQGLDDRFRLLTGGRRTAVPRQQTLQALIDWSWTSCRGGPAAAPPAVGLRRRLDPGGGGRRGRRPGRSRVATVRGCLASRRWDVGRRRRSGDSRSSSDAAWSVRSRLPRLTTSGSTSPTPGCATSSIRA